MGKFSLKKVESANKRSIDPETAVDMLMIFLNFYHIDLEETYEKLKKAGQEFGNLTADDWGMEMVKNIENGSISIEEIDGVPKVYIHLEKPLGEVDTLSFGEIGMTQRKIVMSKNMTAQGKGLAIMESVCDQVSSLFDRIKGSDAKVMEDLATLFGLA